MNDITPEEARDMLDYYSTMDKTRQKYVMENSGMLLERAYGTHRTITMSRKSPLYNYRGISAYRNSTIILEGVDKDPLVQNSYYSLLNTILNNGLPDNYLYQALRGPIKTVSEYIDRVRDLENWYKRNPNSDNDILIFNIYSYITEALVTSYKIDDRLYDDHSKDEGSVEMFRFILNTVKKSVLDPSTANTEKLSDAIDSFYETITGSSPDPNCVLLSLIRRCGLSYDSGNNDDRFKNFMKDKNIIKEIPSTRINSSKLYDIVDRLDRSNVPKVIQQMRSFEKWSNEDDIVNGNVVMSIMPNKSDYFNNAIVCLFDDDLSFVTSATNSRIIPVRSSNSNHYYHFIEKNGKPLILYKLLPVDGGGSPRYFAISLDPENDVIGEITKDPDVHTEFVCESPNKALGQFFME